MNFFYQPSLIKWRLTKLLRIMRITTFLLLIGLMQTYATNTYSQNTKLSLKMEDASLENILNEIEKVSEFHFFYRSNEIYSNDKHTIDANEQTIDELLNSLLKDSKLTYKIFDKYIAIVSKKDVNGNIESLFQQKRVTGKVTDSSGASLPGVSVVVKGSTIGVITDNNGNYSLANIPENSTLQFSFVGMKTQEVTIAGETTTFNVVMKEETIGLEEVVAIGYGTAKKSDLTGAIASVKLEDANHNANVSVMQTLQGSIPGLNIGTVTRAGDDPSLEIRGTNSLSAGQSPLIVVDGIIYEGSITDLSTNDVDRVDILKDASSAAVYGSRSANGVIIITTKRGKTEKPVFDFNTYCGIQEISHKVKMAGGEKYVQKILDWRSAVGLEADPGKIESYLQPLEIENYRNKTYTDWTDLLTRSAPIQQYDLSVSGRTSKTNYYLSGSYTDQKGIVLGDNYFRTTLRANFSNNITSWLTIGMNISYTKKDYPGAEARFLVFASPLSTVYANKETGELNRYPHDDQLTPNPLSYLKTQNKESGTALFSKLYADIKIPKINGLNLHFDYSGNVRYWKSNQFSGKDTEKGILAPNGEAVKSNIENRKWVINTILSYSRKFKQHAIDATILYSREKSNMESTNARAINFPIQVLGWNAMELGSVQENSSSASDNSSEAFMTRLFYTYNSKYLLTATYRRDGFSGFSKGNKFADFPSVSLGWVISEENFVKSMDWLSYLKMRLSYGINGNQALGSYGSLSRMSTLNYVFGDGGSTSSGTYPSSLSNSELTWEKTKSFNLGFNINVLDNRISSEIDIYRGSTDGLLVRRSLPPMTGFSSVWTNLGEIQNKGIEITINTLNISKTDFRWNTKFSFSLNRNKIAKLYGIDNDGDGREDDDIGNKWFIGKSIGAIYDYTLDGIYQLSDTDIPSGFIPGDFRIKDIDGIQGISSNDRSVIGYSTPNYRFGIYNELKYKNISLSFMINSIQGGGKDNYYSVNNNIGLNPNASFDGAAGRLNIPDIDYWSTTNPSNTIPRINYSPKYSHGIYQDRSFIRLQDISLSYSFGKDFTNRMGVNSLNLYISGKNLYTWTNFTGWDPESGNTLSSIPLMRSIVAGLNINF